MPPSRARQDATRPTWEFQVGKHPRNICTPPNSQLWDEEVEFYAMGRAVVRDCLNVRWKVLEDGQCHRQNYPTFDLWRFDRCVFVGPTSFSSDIQY